jgi:hypothetical protein
MEIFNSFVNIWHPKTPPETAYLVGELKKKKKKKKKKNIRWFEGWRSNFFSRSYL